MMEKHGLVALMRSSGRNWTSVGAALLVPATLVKGTEAHVIVVVAKVVLCRDRKKVGFIQVEWP